MIGLDTNVLVRFIMTDDAKQHAAARKCLFSLLKRGEKLYVSNLVLCEVFWVLRSRYKLPKNALMDVIERVIASRDIVLEAEAYIDEILEQYKMQKADFPDLLIGGGYRQAGCKTTLTFDKIAARLEDFTLLA